MGTGMLRTGEQYRDSLRDGREVWIDGARVDDVTRHPAFRPIIDARARIYDMAADPALSETMAYRDEGGEAFSRASKPPRSAQDWHDKRRWVDSVLNDLRGVVIRVGDETVGEMWSLYDGRDMLAEVDPRFSENITRHIARAHERDLFHVSANTDPKGDRSKRPQDQDPDMLLHVVRETDAGIVVRGAKYETAAAYANQAFVKPTIANWGDDKLSDYAVGFICDMGASGLRHVCRSGFARGNADDYPIANRFDEIDTLVIFDDVLVPWENVLFYRHTRAAAFIRGTLHRYSAFPYVQRLLTIADQLIGVALFNVRQTGLDRQPAVREKLAQLVCYREGINAHPHRGDRRRRAEPGRAADAQPVAAVHRARRRLHAVAGDAASGARAVRRPDLRDTGSGELRGPGAEAVARQILQRQRALERAGPAAPAGLCA